MRRWLLGGALLLALVAGVRSAAFAWWSAPGVATGSATTATLNPPASLATAFEQGLDTVDLSWVAPTGLVPAGYYVRRIAEGSGSTAPACGSGPTALLPGPCIDADVPVGSYRYVVTAVIGSWTATSQASGIVTVVPDTTPPAVTLHEVNGAVRTFPYLTNAALTSIGGTCGTAPGDAATVTALIDDVVTSPATAPCTGGAWTLTLDAPLTSDGARVVSARQGDLAGNVHTSPGRSVVVDRTAPTVSSIVRVGSSVAVRSGPLLWTVSFSEPVAAVAATNFAVAGGGITGTPAITAVTATGGSPSSAWTVSVSVAGVTGTNAGSIGVDLTSRGSVADPAGNALATTAHTGPVYAYDTTAPMVSSIVRAGSSVAVRSGPLLWTVSFSEPVAAVAVANFGVAGSGITGTPAITAVSASPGSPSATWTVSVSVVGVTGSNAGSIGVNLTGRGSVADPAGNPLATTASTGQTYTFDTTAATVTAVTSSLANGSYRAGQAIPVTVTFSEPVVVTGVPQLSVATGSPASTPVGYTSGSGSAMLTFTYAVVAANVSVDLDYTATTALALNGGAVTDAAGNAATLALAAPGAAGSLGANKAIVIDNTAPVVTVTRVNGAVRTFPYLMRVNATSIGGTCGTASGDVATVTPLLNGAATVPATATCSSGSWTLTFTTALSTDGSRTMSATQADAAGNVGTAAPRTVTIDRTRPTLTSIVRVGPSAAVNAGPLVWTVSFSEPVAGLAATNFGLAVSGLTGTPSITAVTASGGSPSATWMVSVSLSGVTGTNAGSLGLNLTGRGSVADPATNTLVTTAFTGQAYAYDTTRPTVTGVTSPLADGTYRPGQVVPVTVTFAEPVVVTGVPQLSLATGTPAATAVGYTSGSGTATLTFTYTVATGNLSADLDYTATTALALNGGTITDAAANAATLTLAAPGAAGSLGANKAIVIGP